MTPAEKIIRQVRCVVAQAEGPGTGDAELLERFVRDGDQTAFELVVRRHERMVFGVCRRILRDRQDAEDAFQATFFALARKADSIRRREAVSGWLYTVACRVAWQVRAGVDRRRGRESLHPGLDSVAAPSVPEAVWRDLRPVLDEELYRLPEKFRVPVVLCYLEGKSYAEAAALAGCSRGTLSGRLARARSLLVARLTRRGVRISGALLAAALWTEARAEVARDALRNATVLAAARLAAGEAGSQILPAGLAHLAEGAVRTLAVTRIKLAVAVLAAFVGVGVVGVVGLTYRLPASGQPPQEPAHPGRELSKRPTPDRVGALLQDARKAADAIDDAQWRAWVLQSIAEQQARSGDRPGAARTFQDAIETARLIRSGGIDPTHDARETLVGIAAAQAGAGDARGARQTAEAIEGESRERAREAVALMLAQSGDTEGALQTVRNDAVLCEVARTQARTGRVAEAARTVEAIGNEDLQVQALAALAGAQLKAGDKRAARKSFERAVQIAARIGQHAYVEIVRAQAEAGDLRAAREAADDVILEPWRTRAVFAVQMRAGDFPGALRTAQGIEAWWEKGEALQQVVTAQLRSGDLAGGLRTAGAVPHLYWRAVTLALVAKAQAKTGDRDTAAKTFQTAWALVDRIRDKEPDTGNLRNAAACRIAEAQTEAGERDEQAAVAWARKQPPLRRAQVLMSIAQGVAARRQQSDGP